MPRSVLHWKFRTASSSGADCFRNFFLRDAQHCRVSVSVNELVAFASCSCSFSSRYASNDAVMAPKTICPVQSRCGCAFSSSFLRSGGRRGLPSRLADSIELPWSWRLLQVPSSSGRYNFSDSRRLRSRRPENFTTHCLIPAIVSAVIPACACLR